MILPTKDPGAHPTCLGMIMDPPGFQCWVPTCGALKNSPVVSVCLWRGRAVFSSCGTNPFISYPLGPQYSLQLTKEGLRYHTGHCWARLPARGESLLCKLLCATLKIVLMFFFATSLFIHCLFSGDVLVKFLLKISSLLSCSKMKKEKGLGALSALRQVFQRGRGLSLASGVVLGQVGKESRGLAPAWSLRICSLQLPSLSWGLCWTCSLSQRATVTLYHLHLKIMHFRMVTNLSLKRIWVRVLKK